MKSIFIILLLAITLSVVKSELKYYVDRTADIIIEPKQQNINSLLFLKGNVFNSVELNKLQDTQISTLISHVMGTLPLTTQDRNGFPNVSLFNKPKLNLFFAVDHVSKDDLKGMNFMNGDSIQIQKSMFPMDSVSELTTIFTGVAPNVHGVVGESWENQHGEKVASYARGSHSNSVNLADVQSRTFQGKSIIVSSSSAKPFAAAMSVHPTSHSMNPNGNHHAVFSGRHSTQSIHAGKSVAQIGADSRTLETLLYSREFRAFVLPENWRAVLTSGELQITTANSESVKVDIDTSSATHFLSELAVVYNTVKTLQSKNFEDAVHDAIPDLVSFAFASLNEIDRADPLFRIALAMVDRAMQATYEQLAGLYSNRIACEVVVMDGGDRLTDSSVMKQVTEIVGKHTYPRAESSPSVYLKVGSKGMRKQLCDEISSAIDSATHSVHCINMHSLSHLTVDNVVASSSSSSDNPNNNGTIAASNKVAAFQIFLFLPIVWVIFIVGGILLIMQISADAQKDTLLFRATGRSH